MIIHCWHHMGEIDGETHRRMQVARESRELEYATHPGVWISPALTFARDSRRIGDVQPVPFVRDMISQGLAYAKRPEDFIFVTNADVGFAPGITVRILDSALACHMRRRDLPRIDRVLFKEEIESGDEYPGGDGFAFTARWWQIHGTLFPDMVLGRYGWDSAMRNLIRRSGGMEVKNQLWHETHSAPWNTPGYEIEQNAGNRHNRTLLLKWIDLYGGSTEDHLCSLEELNYR